MSTGLPTWVGRVLRAELIAPSGGYNLAMFDAGDAGSGVAGCSWFDGPQVSQVRETLRSAAQEAAESSSGRADAWGSAVSFGLERRLSTWGGVQIALTRGDASVFSRAGADESEIVVGVIEVDKVVRTCELLTQLAPSRVSWKLRSLAEGPVVLTDLDAETRDWIAGEGFALATASVWGSPSA